MKKIIHIFLLSFFLLAPNFANTYDQEMLSDEYIMTSIEGFINSPSLEDVPLIEDKEEQYCEEVYLEAYRRRDFTEQELLQCGQLFETKQEQEMNYMRFMYSNRGLLD